MKKIFNVILIVLVLLTTILLKDPMTKFILSAILTVLLFVRSFLFKHQEDSSERNIYLLAGVLYGIWTVMQIFSISK